MAIKVARGQVTIIDQNDAVSLQAFIGSSQPLTQVFNKDTGAYAPSWAASPYLILTPSLFVSGKAAVDQISSIGNAATLTAGVKSGSAKWYKDGTVITSGQDSCTIGAASAKYALTVKANHMTVSAPQVLYFRGNLHRCQRAGDSFPCGGTVHPASERGGDDCRRGLCPRRHCLQER